MNPSPEEFIRGRFELAPLSFRPDIRLYRPTPRSGLAGFLAERGEAGRTPYWAYGWAGGAALALYLRDHPEIVRGGRVADFGAGSGLAGIAAALAGAREVCAIEPDPLAHAAIALNARANGVAIALRPGGPLPEIDLILAGDVFYDPVVAAQTLAVLETASCPVLVGDPFRRDLPRRRLEQIAEYEVPDMGGGAAVRSGVFILRRANTGNAG